MKIKYKEVYVLKNSSLMIMMRNDAYYSRIGKKFGATIDFRYCGEFFYDYIELDKDKLEEYVSSLYKNNKAYNDWVNLGEYFVEFDFSNSEIFIQIDNRAQLYYPESYYYIIYNNYDKKNFISYSEYIIKKLLE